VKADLARAACRCDQREFAKAATGCRDTESRAGSAAGVVFFEASLAPDGCARDRGELEGSLATGKLRSKGFARRG